jgi:hypothetical protein
MIFYDLIRDAWIDPLGALDGTLDMCKDALDLLIILIGGNPK